MTNAQIGLRCPKSEQYPLGWKKVDSIPADEVCVVYLGGDGSVTDKDANGYAKIADNDVSKVLGLHVPVYGVTYDFGETDAGLARRVQFLKHRAATLLPEKRAQKILDNAAAQNLKEVYIDKLYKNIVEPRIVPAQKGRRFSAEEIAQNIRKITFISHCHGGYVAYGLEQRMKAQLKDLGYSLAERKNILVQMLVVAHAPACPLGVQQSSFYAFRSAYDAEGNTGWNLLPEYIRRRKYEERMRFYGEQSNNAAKIEQNHWFELPATYLEKKRLFLIKQKHPWINEEDGPFMANPAEHGDLAYGSPQQTDDGRGLMMLARNVLVGGVMNSLDNKEKYTPLPPIEELILEHSKAVERCETYNKWLGNVFNKMKENGKKLIADIVTDFKNCGR